MTPSAIVCHTLGTQPNASPPDADPHAHHSTSCLLAPAWDSRDGRRDDRETSAFSAPPSACIGPCTSRPPMRQPFCRALPSPPGIRKAPEDCSSEAPAFFHDTSISHSAMEIFADFGHLRCPPALFHDLRIARSAMGIFSYFGHLRLSEQQHRQVIQRAVLPLIGGRLFNAEIFRNGAGRAAAISVAIAIEGFQAVLLLIR